MNKAFVQKWGILPPVALFVIFPLTFVLGKMGFEFGPQIFFIAVRMFISGIFLLVCCVCFRRNCFKIKSRDLWLFFQFTLFGIGSYIPEFWALKYVSIAKTALIFLTVPFFSALFELLHGTSVLTKRKFVGLIVGLCGVLPMILSETQDGSFNSHWGITFPEFLVLISTAGYAYGWIPVKKLVTQRGYSSLFVNAFGMSLGSIVALASSYFLEGWDGLTPPVISWSHFLWYSALISCVGVLCYSLYGFLLKQYSATMIAFAGFTEPLFAALYAWILLGETVSWIFFFSLSIVSLGLCLFYREELRLIL